MPEGIATGHVPLLHNTVTDPNLPEYVCFHATPLPKLLKANLRVHHDDVACKGGVMPDFDCSILCMQHHST